jgi:hypothetical protein
MAKLGIPQLIFRDSLIRLDLRTGSWWVDLGRRLDPDSL